ncbi:MAG TPA: zinc-binding dehydrogenase [Kribbellaceae bacterium]|nr:zinc-binding dehydrogenase [Kribbellaceae bacterium]
MRALVVRQFGDPDAIELIETDTPVPGPGEVRIKVAAAAVNPVDLATAGVTGVQPGSEVVGLVDLLARSLKTHGEPVVLDARAVAPAPRNVDPVAASSFGLNALTALQALDRLDLIAGESLPVTGAAGGVGGYAVELAKHRGLTVIAVAGEDDEELVRGFGADHFVPRSADLATAVRAVVPGGADAAVDAVVLGVGTQDGVRNGGQLAYLIGGSAPG